VPLPEPIPGLVIRYRLHANRPSRRDYVIARRSAAIAPSPCCSNRSMSRFSTFIRTPRQDRLRFRDDMPLPVREWLSMLLPPSYFYRRRIAEEARSGEPELAVLATLVPHGGTAVGVGANPGVSHGKRRTVGSVNFAPTRCKSFRSMRSRSWSRPDASTDEPILMRPAAASWLVPTAQ
jgi:hypothetical protein